MPHIPDGWPAIRNKFAAGVPGVAGLRHSEILAHCPRRVHAGSRQAHQELEPGGHPRGRGGPHAAELRAHEEAGRGLEGDRLPDESAKLVIYRAFVEGELDVSKHLARRVHDPYFNPQIEDFAPRTTWSLQRVHERIQGTRSYAAVQGDSQARGILRRRPRGVSGSLKPLRREGRHKFVIPMAVYDG